MRIPPDVSWVGGFFAVIIVGVVVFGVFFIIHDRGVTCHERVRKSDACWKDLNQTVRDLQTRVHELEQR